MSISRLSDTEVRVCTADNREGKPYDPCRTVLSRSSPAFVIGPCWKTNPHAHINHGERQVLADFREDRAGYINSMWFAFIGGEIRHIIIMVYYDDCPIPSMVFPLGDAVCNRWGQKIVINSRFIRVAPNNGLTLMLPAPFRRGFHIEVEYLGSVPMIEERKYEQLHLFYAFELSLLPRGRELPADEAYLHAIWSISNPVQNGKHSVLKLEGEGHLVGWTHAITPHSDNWWGEGPPFCRIDEAVDDQGEPVYNWYHTGTEDPYGHAWDSIFEHDDEYTSSCGPFAGFMRYPPNGPRFVEHFGAYRFFTENSKINFRQSIDFFFRNMGMRPDIVLEARADSMATTAYVYLKDLPKKPLAELPRYEEHRRF